MRKSEFMVSIQDYGKAADGKQELPVVSAPRQSMGARQRRNIIFNFELWNSFPCSAWERIAVKLLLHILMSFWFLRLQATHRLQAYTLNSYKYNVFMGYS
jgi:hypothetical protein